MPLDSTPSDEDLLLSADPEDFGRFYDRNVHAILGYFSRRTHDAELAADLTAETFAAALVARRRYRIGATPPVAWLFGIAQHKLVDARRRGGAEDRMQRRLGMERVPLTGPDEELIELLGREVAAEMVRHLPPDQREAVTAHVIDERSYEEIALQAQTSQATVRQRVSRGLRTLRDRIEVNR